MPQKAEQLQKQLPGVGPYTAAAIGSVSLKKKLLKIIFMVYGIISEFLLGL